MDVQIVSLAQSITTAWPSSHCQHQFFGLLTGDDASWPFLTELFHFSSTLPNLHYQYQLFCHFDGWRCIATIFCRAPSSSINLTNSILSVSAFYHGFPTFVLSFSLLKLIDLFLEFWPWMVSFQDFVCYNIELYQAVVSTHASFRFTGQKPC